jgi:hypothetical protein
MRSKVRLLFTRRDGVDDEILDRRFAEEDARIAASFDGPLSFVHGFAVRDEQLHRIAAGAFDAADRPFDAMMEAIVPNGALPAILPVFEGLAGRLGDAIDPARSAGLAGTEHVIVPGTGPLFVLIANRRLPNFTHQGFLDYWLDYHGPFARANVPPETGMAYRQFHTDEAATALLLRHSGLAIGDFDGAAECFYRDEAALRDLMGRSEVVDQATVDEKHFVDHERCVTSLFAIGPEGLSFDTVFDFAQPYSG